MALSTPAGTYLFVGGINVTGDIYSASVEMENLVEETHTFGDSFEETTPIGIGKLTLTTGEGLYDDRLNGQLEAFRDAPLNTTQLFMMLLSGDDPGNPAIMLDGIYTVKYNRGPKKDGLTMASAEHMVNARYRVDGLLLHGTDSVVANGNTATALLETDIMFPYPAVDIVESFTNDVITTRTQHGLKAGDFAFIADHVGATADPNSTAGTAGGLIATVPDNYSFTLDGVTISGAGTGGTLKKAKGVSINTSNTAEVITTYTNHGFSVGDKIFIAGHVGATPALNTAAYGVGETILTVPSETTFTIGGPITVGGTGGRAIRIGMKSAYADLHVPALVLDGATNVLVKVRHSDESAANYADAASFTAVTAVDASERKTITDLKRFRACSWVFTGGTGANGAVQIVAAAEINR